MDGAGQLLDVVRIDEQSIGELQRRAREGAKDEDALIILTRSDKLLGDEIHAVVERSDHTERSGAIEARNLLVGVVPIQEHDGLPAAGLEARVDALDFGCTLVEQGLVALNIRAAGRANLHEGEQAS